MNVGVLKETKLGEGRVALTPGGAAELVSAGATVSIQKDAGAKSGFSDDDYIRAGATIVEDASGLYTCSTLVVKVKEMTEAELPLLRADHVLFCYLHPRMFRPINEKVLATGCAALTYEEVVTDDGARPLLRPMSEIAGKLAPIKAIEHMQSIRGGAGILPMGVQNVPQPVVLIIGGGVAGTAAAETALGLGDRVVIIESDPLRRDTLRRGLPSAEVLESTQATIRGALPAADVVINTASAGANPGKHLISRDMLAVMKRSSIIVDVACDRNGPVETCRVTSHADPVYEVDGIMHYCVDNMPGAVPATASVALCAATFPYVRAIALKGLAVALREDRALARSLAFAGGNVSNAEFAEILGVPSRSPTDIVA